MRIAYSRSFQMLAKRLSPSLRQKLLERLKLFARNPLHPTLRNHALQGAYRDYRSINITGDVRALYLQTEQEAIFDLIGTYSQLYG